MRLPLRRIATTASFVLLAATLCACGLTVDAEPDGPFARLGPPDAPVRLHYEVTGKGAPILLIHGFGTNTYTWRFLAPELARDHKVITVDLKGFGQSDKPLDERYAASDQAELVAQLIQNLNLRNLTVVGHSFGGGVALLLAMQTDGGLKGRISRLVLIDSVAYPQNIPVFFRLLDMPGVSQVGINALPMRWQTEVALRIAFFDHSKINEQEVDAYAGPLATPEGKHAIIYSAREIVPPDLDALAARYSSIALPTLILWGDHDRIVPLDIGLKLRHAMPNAHLKIVLSCGHMPQEEQPEVTLQYIRDFLANKPDL